MGLLTAQTTVPSQNLSVTKQTVVLQLNRTCNQYGKRQNHQL